MTPFDGVLQRACKGGPLVDIKCTFWLILKIFLFTPHEKSPKIHYFYVKIKQNPKFNPKLKKNVL